MDTPCVIWTGAVTSRGYGCRTVGGKKWLAHRYAYVQARGPIPDGLVLDHLCRVPLCVNPDHLEPVTQRENILRGEGEAARHARATHCPHGHPYDEANTYTSPSGRRYCRECARIRDRARYSKAGS